MIKKVVTFFITALFGAGILVSPALAAENTIVATLGSEAKACNATAKTALEAVRTDYKAGTITKDVRNTRVKEAGTARTDCLKAAQAKAKTAREAKRAEEKAKMEAKRTEMKAKMEAKRAEAKATARKTTKSTKY